MDASPALTGTPTAPTQTAGDNSTAVATTAYVDNENLTNANLTGPITSVGNATSIASQTGTGTTFVMDDSPVLTGTPSLPTGTIAVTQGAGNNTTAIATTAFVQTITTASAAAVYGHVTGNALQSIPKVTPTDLTTHWDGTPRLSGGVTFESGVFTVPTAGFYQITASFSYSVNGGGARSASIRVNNSTIIGYQNIAPVFNDRTGMNLSAGIYLNANSNVRILAYQGSASAIDINNAITGNFSIAKIGN